MGRQAELPGTKKWPDQSLMLFLQGAVVAPEAPPVAAGVGGAVAAGALLGLVAGAVYLRARSKATGFGFSIFQVGLDWGLVSTDLAQGPSPLTCLLRQKMTQMMTFPHGRKGPAQPWSLSPTQSLALMMPFVSPLM